MSIKEKVLIWSASIAVVGGAVGSAYMLNGFKAQYQREYGSQSQQLRQLNGNARKLNMLNPDTSSAQGITTLITRSNTLLDYAQMLRATNKSLTVKPILDAAGYFSLSANAKATFKVDSSFNAEMKAKKEQFARQERANAASNLKLNKQPKGAQSIPHARIRML